MDATRRVALPEDRTAELRYRRVLYKYLVYMRAEVRHADATSPDALARGGDIDLRAQKARGITGVAAALQRAVEGWAIVPPTWSP
jgi:hypothetical protein